MANGEYMGGMLTVRGEDFRPEVRCGSLFQHLTAQIAGAYKVPRLSSRLGMLFLSQSLRRERLLLRF
jgi:hypothetical protein